VLALMVLKDQLDPQAPLVPKVPPVLLVPQVLLALLALPE
jgi:hypothetical protein